MNQTRRNGVVLLAVESDQKVSCVCVFFRGFKKNPMRRVLGFLVLGFWVVVAMVLDEGDGVALLVVSNSETRSRGQGSVIRTYVDTKKPRKNMSLCSLLTVKSRREG
ncbi:hypothetical protein Tco_0658407 [Tanacetum coccineum]|uniref:Transmembrane protein n=1 Tax=Tanacetum coccineum TaxID=301880 RepID=A0ABQ5BID5_9ASTR